MTTDSNDFQGGHTPLTPPPASAPQEQTPAQTSSAPAGDGTRGRSPGATAILITTAVIGGVALLGAGGTAAVAATGTVLRSSDRNDAVQTIDAAGIESLDLDVDAGDMRIEFGDVDDARLVVTNGRGPGWTLDREGDELVVRSPDSRFGWWFGGWFGDDESAVLTLPEALKDSAIDADLTVDAGGLDVDGDFGTLDVTVNAGSLDVEAAATSLDIDMNAGRADVVVDGAEDAGLSVAAGDLTVELTGSAPSQTTVDVSAGSVDLTVPDVAYAITQDVAAGSLDARVQESSSAGRVIEVSLSAGSVTIRPGR